MPRMTIPLRPAGYPTVSSIQLACYYLSIRTVSDAARRQWAERAFYDPEVPKAMRRAYRRSNGKHSRSKTTLKSSPKNYY